MIKIEIYYIKQGKLKLFKKIDLHENTCEVLKKLDSKLQIESVIKQIKKNDIKLAVLSKDLYENAEFLEKIKTQNIKVFDGRWLYSYIIPEVVEYICKKSNLDNEIEIVLLTNDLTDEFLGNMEEISKNFKKIKITTEYPEKFRKIDNKILEDSGFSMIISQNRKKALSKSNIIINFDFSEEVINQYSINENAIIIDLSNGIKINKKRFNGIVIKDYDIEYKQENDKLRKDVNEFYIKHIIESRIFKKALTEKKLEEVSLTKFNIIRRIIKEENIKIKNLYGKNGYVL